MEKVHEQNVFFFYVLHTCIEFQEPIDNNKNVTGINF